MDVMEGVATTLAAGDVFVLTADRPMTKEHADRLKEFVSAALPEGVRVLVLDPGFSFEVLPAPIGISRVADNDRALLVSFRGMPTDDAMRAVHELLKGAAPARDQAAGVAVLDGPELWEILFGVFKGDVPAELTDDRLTEIADAIRTAFAGAVPESVYLSAVKGRRDFRAAMSEARLETEAVRSSFNNAMEYALTKITPQETWGFLDAWTHGQFDVISRDYPDFVFGSERPVNPVTYHVTEEGEPWAVYREGVWPAASITRQDVIDAMNLYGSGDGDDWAKDNPELPTVTTFYVTGERPEPESTTRRRKGDDDDDAPLDDLGVWFCEAGAPGAYPVTGFKLYGG